MSNVPLDRAAKHMMRRALRWFRSKKPLAWKERQHLEQPWVNCTNDWEKDLARACARYLRERS